MRSLFRSALVGVAVAGLSFAGVASAHADGPDDDSNVVINNDPGPGLLGGRNWGNGNWNSGDAFGSLIKD